MPEGEAVTVSREITERGAAIAAEHGYALTVASRSDSTLRGHFPAESDAVADALEASSQRVDGVLLCPCFLEAGRLTVDDVQWVAEGDDLVLSGRTHYTSRALARAEGSDAALDVGRSISDALVELVRRLDPRLPLAFCVAKGGITASDIGAKGFGVRRAEIAGQMLPGMISVWILSEDAPFPGLPYVIFPGNVGDDGALAEVVERLRGEAG